MAVERPAPHDFLELVHQGRQGKLRIYLGFVAGVGKTYRMLQEAHVLKERGSDVVIGAVDTHGRPETAALIPGLEIATPRSVEYRGITISEMDVEAVLARAPEICLVDEVAHTNAPGSKNRKRYQDILELLESGINVLAAFNLQHLESLNDMIERATGVRVRETVPDTFLRRADQIVNVDLPVEDLLDRLKAGKIYADERIPWALEHFFRQENLLSLRELTLRETAESVERAGRRGLDAGQRPLSGDRVMVAISSMPLHAAALLRRGSRMAGRLNAHWFVVYVETPAEAPGRIDPDAQRHLLENFQRAEELGAEVVRLDAKDPVPALLDFARSHRVGHLILGRTRQPWWRRLLRRSPVHRIVDEAEGIDVYIASLEREERPE
ncbi:MAG: universal stress protein [Deltaproteobacteria bacterium]|nr:universal stress protein [Deltaproteobacteria bacterium]